MLGFGIARRLGFLGLARILVGHAFSRHKPVRALARPIDRVHVDIDTVWPWAGAKRLCHELRIGKRSVAEASARATQTRWPASTPSSAALPRLSWTQHSPPRRFATVPVLDENGQQKTTEEASVTTQDNLGNCPPPPGRGSN